MRWLVRLITPPGGIVLDPFAGSGTTGEGAIREGCRTLLIEQEAEHVEDIDRRMMAATRQGELFR
jgi:site-specific DNA-methyltransferase (adenine-specific)